MTVWCSSWLRACSGIAARLMVVRILTTRYPTLPHCQSGGPSHCLSEYHCFCPKQWVCLHDEGRAAEQFKGNDLETDHAHVPSARHQISTIKSESMSISQTTGQEPTATNRGQLEYVRKLPIQQR